MVTCLCFLQEGQLEAAVIDRLGEGIEQIVAANDLGDNVDFSWVEVPEGNGWTAGEMSTTSVVTLTTPPISQDRRVSMLRALCDLWMERTGCRIDEVLATVVPAA